MGLSLAEKVIYLPKRYISPRLGTEMCTISIYGMRISQNFGLFLLAIARSDFFFLPLSFPFSWPFHSRYLLRFIFFLAAVKKLGVNYGQSLEMGP